MSKTQVPDWRETSRSQMPKQDSYSLTGDLAHNLFIYCSDVCIFFVASGKGNSRMLIKMQITENVQQQHPRRDQIVTIRPSRIQTACQRLEKKCFEYLRGLVIFSIKSAYLLISHSCPVLLLKDELQNKKEKKKTCSVLYSSNSWSRLLNQV